MKYIEILAKRNIMYWKHVRKIVSDIIGNEHIIYYAYIKQYNGRKTIGIFYVLSDNVTWPEIVKVKEKVQKMKNILSVEHGEMYKVELCTSK